ncbi:MAG: hypothetical protein ACTSV1_01765 [Alphaproteobacteria bacterium]
MIVFIMAVIVYGLYRKSSDPDFKYFDFGAEPVTRTAPAQSPAPVPTAGLKGFGEVLVSLPDGCSITGVTGEGKRLFLKIGPAGPPCERVIVLDADTGAILGDIKATP